MMMVFLSGFENGEFLLTVIQLCQKLQRISVAFVQAKRVSGNLENN